MYSKRIVDQHATMRMAERNISQSDLDHVLATGEMIEYVPSNLPLPKELILGFIGARPLHVVIWNNDKFQTSIVHTVYEPDLVKWYPDYKTRR